MTRLVFAAALLAVLAPAAARADDKVVYKIGAARSSFREVPTPLLALAGQPFQDLLKTLTGLDGVVSLDAEWAGVARDVDAGKLHLGVMQGHEFAWARARYPDLRPLVCPVYRPKEVQALLLVRYDAKATTLGDLKDPKLALAVTLKDHAKLFLAKRRAADMGGKEFASTVKTDTVHEAIEKVMDGAADVTVADLAAWNYFQKLYPGPSQNLKVLARSEEFPLTVVLYKQGGVEEGVLKRLRDGFLAAHETPRAARMMGTIRIDKFAEPPADYEDALKACLKAYPVPEK